MDSEMQITEEQRNWLSSLSPVEIMDVYCEEKYTPVHEYPLLNSIYCNLSYYLNTFKNIYYTNLYKLSLI